MIKDDSIWDYLDGVAKVEMEALKARKTGKQTGVEAAGLKQPAKSPLSTYYGTTVVLGHGSLGLSWANQETYFYQRQK